MSEEIAMGDSASGDEAKVNGDEAMAASAVQPEQANSEHQEDPAPPEPEETTAAPTEGQIKPETTESVTTESARTEPATTEQPDNIVDWCVKRRASTAFSETSEEFHGFEEGSPKECLPKEEEEFKGFEQPDNKDLSDYNRILERLETEVAEARKSFTPLRSVVANMAIRATKRARQDTDGSRPSSALSSRSDGDGSLLIEGAGAASSPAGRRRATAEMSSPAYRVPLDCGWRRELVYRAALDAHSRRNADIYYYTPRGKKLRSTREVAEHLSGTGLTLENFTFFKEPLGVDDPEKETIRDAKLVRRVESPIASPAAAPLEGKRTPKPKPPKGASPDRAPLRSPPAKIKVKSVGSRLSGSSPAASAHLSKQQKKPLQTATSENNNTAAWKKPRLPPAAAGAPPAPPGPAQPAGAPPSEPAPAPAPPPPPPLQSRPQHPPIEDKPLRQSAVQTCSLTCGRGVPTLACGACLCLYHPACVGLPPAAPAAHHAAFLCKNCDESGAPPSEPPPLVHKSQPRRAPPQPPPPPHHPPARPRADQRVLLRMKVSGGGPDGERVWAVAKVPPSTPAPIPTPIPTPAPPPKPPAPVPRGQASLPQSIAVLNGRRFIVVPRNLIQHMQHQ